MDEITEDLVARIASRLYNELPGAASPGSSSDLLNSSQAAAEQSVTFKNLPEEIPSASSSEEVLSLEQIANTFQSFTPKIQQGEMPASNADGFYFLKEQTPEHSAPLGYHADNLVRQQTLNGKGSEKSSDDGLRSFVERIQTCEHRLTGGIGFADPFAALLKTTLPENPKFSSAGIFDVSAIRRDFPILNQKVHGKPLAWFDNAATTQKPQSVIDAVSNFYSRDNSNIHRGAHTLAARATEAYEQAREKVRTYIGAGDVSEIVFVRGTTEGINLIAQTYGRKFFQPGDEVILTTLEHHANIVPWQLIAKEKGAVIRVVPVNDRGEIILEEYQKLLGPRTKLVAFAHANNSLGTVLPVKEMTQLARRYGARVLIDGAQSVAHIPVNVQDLDCDFFVFSGHKIFAPTGIGALYIKKELHDLIPPWQGGGSMIKNVTFEETTYSEAPAKFEAGTPSIADAVGLGAALDYVSRVGLINIANYEHKLLQYATDHLSAISGLQLFGSAREKVALLSFIVKNRSTEEVGKLLDQEGIAVRASHHCAQPSLRRFGLSTTVRPSFAFYNTFEEIDRLRDALKRIAK